MRLLRKMRVRRKPKCLSKGFLRPCNAEDACRDPRSGDLRVLEWQTDCESQAKGITHSAKTDMRLGLVPNRDQSRASSRLNLDDGIFEGRD